jgi:hypothetical protein
MRIAMCFSYCTSMARQLLQLHPLHDPRRRLLLGHGSQARSVRPPIGPFPRKQSSACLRAASSQSAGLSLGPSAGRRPFASGPSLSVCPGGHGGHGFNFIRHPEHESYAQSGPTCNVWDYCPAVFSPMGRRRVPPGVLSRRVSWRGASTLRAVYQDIRVLMGWHTLDILRYVQETSFH